MQMSPQHEPIVNRELPATIHAMWSQDFYKDATLVVEGNALKVHRVVLAAASTVFDGMLRRSVQQGETQCAFPRCECGALHILLGCLQACMAAHGCSQDEHWSTHQHMHLCWPVGML